MAMTLVERHEQLIPQGTQVASKGRFRNCRGFGPAWAMHGRGAYVFDDTGRMWMDWSCGLGALTIGHGWGLAGAPSCLPLPHPVEVELAELLNEWVPCAEQVRFMKSGSDAVSAAVRMARVYTGREYIVDAGTYHGCHDWAVSKEHEGIPQAVRDLTQHVPFGDLEALEDVLLPKKVACLVLEPVSLIEPPEWYLKRARELCDQTGTVLIFDEVITGIRMAKGGAQEAYGVIPDICAIGKGMANGYPISAVCGKSWLMECWSRTHYSGTHFADPSCMEAAVMCMTHLQSRQFWEHQEEYGGLMLLGVQDLIDKHDLGIHCKAIGHSHWWVLQIADAVNQTYVQQELMRQGILGSNGSHFMSLAHGPEEVHRSLEAYAAAFYKLKDGIRDHDVAQRLECDVNKTVFRRT